MFENKVFKRKSASGRSINGSVYNLLIGLVLCWGFAVNWLMVETIAVETITGINIFIFILGYFASCLFGIYLFNRYDKPLISFIGYNFVVVPFGLIINLVVSQYDRSLVLDAIQVTGTVTVSMMVLGTLFPKFFKKISGALSVALFCIIIVEFFQIFVFGTVREWVDWVVVLIFCGYIGYDWGRANHIPKTVDNAIDSAAALYMDIIILFLRILRIMGRRR